jgi:acetyl-CoA synthetase
VLPPTPETAAIFFGFWKLGAILLSMSMLYGDDSIRHRLSDSGAKLAVTDADNAPRFGDSKARTLLLDADTLAGASTSPFPATPQPSCRLRRHEVRGAEEIRSSFRH